MRISDWSSDVCSSDLARADAQRDPLAQLPNRRVLEERYAIPTDAHAAICLAMCDIDHFKQVNDRFGHAVGDRVLRAIGTALDDICVDHLVARYGGEEFAVLFTGVSDRKSTRLNSSQ